MDISCSWPTKEKINFKLLNLGYNIKVSILWACLSSYLVKKERIARQWPQWFPSYCFLQELSTIFELKSSPSIKASNKRKWLISLFSFWHMDIIAFKTSLKNQWPLDWFKMPTMTTRDNVYYNMWYVPCEWRGNMTNNPKTNMLDVIKENGFLELKYFF